MFKVAFLSLLWTLATGNASAIAQSNRVALVIGNSAYPGAMALKNPVNDAKLVSDALRTVGFQVTHLKDRSKSQLLADLTRATKTLNEGDLFFFFFAGHGLQVNNSNYLVPIDAEITQKEHIVKRCIPASDVLNTIKNSGSSMKVMALDCCRNNPFRSVTRGVEKGFAKMPAPEGTVIAFSTAPGLEAADGAGDNSPFSKHLVKTLGAKYPSGLDISDWFRITARVVKKETGQRGFLELDASMEPYLIKGTGVALLDQQDHNKEFKIGMRTKTKQRLFREDERLACEVTATHDCFVSIFSIDPTGDLTLLVPNEWHPDGLKVKANESLQFPTKKMGFEIFVKPPHGRTLIKAIATRRPLKIAGVNAQRLKAESIVALGNSQQLKTSDSSKNDVTSPFNLAQDFLSRKFADGQWATFSVVIETLPK